MPVYDRYNAMRIWMRARAAAAHGYGRMGMITACTAGLLLVLCANTASALNLYHDLYITLAARPLSMGGAAAAVPDPSSVFSNPGCLAALRNLRLMYNHSARHFPGSQEGGVREWDQLDGDTEAVVVPLLCGTYAHGFTLDGEMGYDYTHHPQGGLSGYPREGLWGGEDYDALAFGNGLPVAAGVALRRNHARFTPASEDSASPPWFRHGEGMQWGVLARIWPGVEYGRSELKLDHEYILLASPAGQVVDDTSRQSPTVSARLKTLREGVAVHPCGWLTLANDSVRQAYRFRDAKYAGILHRGDTERASMHCGGEVCLGNGLKLRWGNDDGRSTLGLSAAVGSLWLNYTEVQDLLPEITGGGEAFKDVHIYGFDWALF